MADNDKPTTSGDVPKLPEQADTSKGQLTGAQRIDRLQQLLKKGKGAYVCGAAIDKGHLDAKDLVLYYTHASTGDGDANEVQVEIRDALSFPPTEEDLSRFIRAASPSPLGKHQATVYDPEYRLAREYKRPAFALSSELVSHTLVLPTIARQLNITEDLIARLAKVNIYEKGGFFKAHRDTPRGEGHIGTITFCLPTTFTGGELVVRHADQTVTFDWGRGRKKDGEKADEPGADPATIEETELIHWAFIYPDCDHEILPTATTRFYRSCPAPESPPVLDIRVRILDPAEAYLKSLLADKDDFLPDGGHLGFGLTHQYGIPLAAQRQGYLEKADLVLKGVDRHLVSLLDRLGLQWTFQARYDLSGTDLTYYEDEDEDEMSDTSHQSVVSDKELDEPVSRPLGHVSLKTVGPRYKYDIARTINIFSGLDEEYVNEEYRGNPFRGVMEEKSQDAPAGSHMDDRNRLQFPPKRLCGHSIGTIYVGLGLIVDVPPATARTSQLSSGISSKRQRIGSEERPSV